MGHGGGGWKAGGEGKFGVGGNRPRTSLFEVH